MTRLAKAVKHLNVGKKKMSHKEGTDGRRYIKGNKKKTKLMTVLALNRRSV